MMANGHLLMDAPAKTLLLSLDGIVAMDDQSQALAVEALWRAFASQLKRAMKEAGISADDMAKRMNVTTAKIDLLMTSGGDLISLGFLQRAAGVVGRNIKLDLV